MESALIQKDIDAIREHMTTMNSEMGELRDEQKNQNETLTEMRIDMADVKNNVEWLKRFFFIIVTASLGSLIATIISFLIKK